MELLLHRDIFGEDYTTGKLSVDGEPTCYILEDQVRDGPKVHGETAIPEGRYQVIVDYSNRFKCRLPHILDVPGFEGIRIHPGNRPENTEGCLLPGLTRGVRIVSHSRDAFDTVFGQIKSAISAGDQVFITIENGADHD